MNDPAKLASACDEKLAKIYIASTVECILFSATCVGMILYYLGFTSFSILQSIGSILFMLLIFTLVLKIRKSNVKKDIEKHYNSDDDRAEFESFLKEHSLDYEFLYAVMIKPTPANDTSSSSDDASAAK